MPVLIELEFFSRDTASFETAGERFLYVHSERHTSDETAKYNGSPKQIARDCSFLSNRAVNSVQREVRHRGDK